MNCPNCGSKVDATDRFCTNCGGALPVFVPKPKKNIKPVLTAVIVFVCVLFVASKIKTAYDSKPENKFKKTAKEFVKLIEEEDYEEAKNLLGTTGNVQGSFEDFAKENLQGAKLEKGENGYRLAVSDEVYELTSNEDGDRLLSDDFLMEYKVKCSSYLTNDNKPFKGMEGEVLDDGMTIYTVKAYKSHHIAFDCGVCLGESADIFQMVTYEAAVDDDYKVTEIEDAHITFTSSAYDKSSAYVMEDGTIVVDRYEVQEDFAEKIARTFSGYGTDMSNAALANISYEDFYARYSDYIFNTDCVKTDYESWIATRDYISRYITYVEYYALNWEYPTEFRYSSGEYILKENVKLSSYKDEKESVMETADFYVMFKPGKTGFKVFSYSDKKENLYETIEIGDDTNEVEDAAETTDTSNEQAGADGSGDELDDFLRNEVLPAYQEYVSANELEGEWYNYALIYLNDDDIPELVTCWGDDGAMATEYHIVTYEDGNVRSMQVYATSIYYIERGDYIWYDYSTWEDDGYTWVYIDNLADVVDFETVRIHEGICKGYTDDTKTYTIDGVECSEEEYNSCFDTSDMISVRNPSSATVEDAFYRRLGIE